MKKLLSIIVLITQLMPFAKGQEFAFAHSNTTPEYASANSGYDVILSHTVHKQIHPLIVTGGILASCGAITTVVGFCYYYTAFDTYSGGVGTPDPVNTPVKDAGEGIMMAGGTIAIAGCIFMIIGRHKAINAYSWKLITPRPNELGLAYNF